MHWSAIGKVHATSIYSYIRRKKQRKMHVGFEECVSFDSHMYKTFIGENTLKKKDEWSLFTHL
jgi:hypothetical protein